MLPGDFICKLRKLNRKLRIYCLDDKTKPAGLYYVERSEYVPVCSVDKNEIPKHAIANEQNKIIKSGWQRTLRVLIQKRLTTKREAEKVFGPLDSCKVVRHKTTDEVERIKELHDQKRYYGEVDANGQPIFNNNEVLDMKAELDLRR